MTLAKRRAAARKHQPDHIKLLLVAEAPPCDGERYFYYPDVEQHDWLYRYVWQALSGQKPEKNEKAANESQMREVNGRIRAANTMLSNGAAEGSEGAD
mgnify:CR=1 FL=1